MSGVTSVRREGRGKRQAAPSQALTDRGTYVSREGRKAMARFRIRLEVHRSERGIALASLGKLPEEAMRFLKFIGEDVQIAGLQSEWIARDFEDGSFLFTVESAGEADEEQVRTYRGALNSVIDYEPKTEAPVGIRNETLAQYARLANAIAHNESLRMGFFTNGSERPDEWRDISKQQSAGIAEYFDELIESTGTIQGIVHSLYKESQPPYFDLRELSNEKLIKCQYPPQLYEQVIGSLKKRDAIVIVQGEITARRRDRKIDHIVVRQMKVAPELTADDLEEFFGCAPDFTGDLSTEEYIRRMRGYAD